MKQNVYVTFDKVRNRALRVFFEDNNSSAMRENVPRDLRSQDNPIGLPFQDLAYKQIATYDTETMQFENISPIEIDILGSYQFKVEKPMEDKPDLKEVDLARPVS